jgi:dCTP diphosphatase
MKKKFNLDEISNYLTNFAKERNWEQFHTPKNLACALSVEASELLEIFQWKTALEENNLFDKKNPERKKIEDEISDVVTYAIRLCDVLDINLEKVMKRKFKENEEKYPADQVKGSARKYDEY